MATQNSLPPLIFHPTNFKTMTSTVLPGAIILDAFDELCSSANYECVLDVAGESESDNRG